MFEILPNITRSHPKVLLSCLLFASSLAQAEAWVITDQEHPVSAPAPSTRIILLDDQQRLEEKLSTQLTADPSQVTATIQHYLSTPPGKRLLTDLVHAQQGITDAWSLGIEKIPAVVVDRRYVIYGETDVAKAVERINQARGSSQ